MGEGLGERAENSSKTADFPYSNAARPSPKGARGLFTLHHFLCEQHYLCGRGFSRDCICTKLAAEAPPTTRAPQNATQKKRQPNRATVLELGENVSALALTTTSPALPEECQRSLTKASLSVRLALLPACKEM